MSELGTYKGLPITGTSIIVNKLGDGLSKAVNIDPVVIEAGEHVGLAVIVHKTKDRYDLETDSEGTPIGYTLVQVFDASGATFSDASVIMTSVRKMRAKIEAAEREAKGQLSLGVGVEDADEPVPGLRAVK